MRAYAVLFPGQGSQHQDMLSTYIDNEIFHNTINEASDILGYNIFEIVKDEPKLNNTLYTQPIMLSVATAMWRVWEEKCDIAPSSAAGHSLGEYSALVANGFISFPDCLDVVQERAKLMNSSMNNIEGGMAAIIGLKPKDIESICDNLSGKNGIIEAVNYNSDMQTVVAGHIDVVRKSVDIFKSSGAKIVKLLPVSIAAHTSLMKKCSESLYKVLLNKNLLEKKDDGSAESSTKHSFSVIHNVDASSKTNNHDIIESLVKQVYSPVLWTQTIKNINNLNTNIFIEIGPGNVLTGLNKRILSDANTASISDFKNIDDALRLISDD
ncbi:MAG: ACP S-malonyltransferase [Gammaproteobacteria bacterium]